MDKHKILEVVTDITNKPNKDLISARDSLINEFNETKKIIIDLTRHLDSVERLYNSVNEEIKKRNIK